MLSRCITLSRTSNCGLRKPRNVLGEDLLVVGRQCKTPVGILDLLCIDGDGVPVIVEVKRASTPREAIAQALDYASWLDSQSEDEFKELAEQYLKKPLAEAFAEHFPSDLPDEIECQKHRIILVAPRLDAAAERIINYLAERYRVAINAVFFKYAKLDSEEILVRSVLVAEEVGGPGRTHRSKQPKPDPEELQKIAEERKVTALVNICRQVKDIWDEGTTGTHGGSWIYSLHTDKGWRSLFGINVSGKLIASPVGDLAVWVRAENVSEVTSTDESVIRNALAAGHSQLGIKSGNTIVRLQTTAEAEKLVQQLKEWASSTKPQAAVV